VTQNSDAARIAAECCDVLAHPLQCLQDVS
jgi:hypothetical protein